MLLDYMCSVVLTSITLIIVGLYQRNHSGIFKGENEDINEMSKQKPRYSLVIEYDSSNRKHRLIQSSILLIVILMPIINILVGIAFSWYTLKMSLQHRNT